MRVALAQTPCAVGDKKENLARMNGLISGHDADLYVFPELFLTGYMVRDEVYRLAEGVDGPSVSAVARMAAEAGASILFGMPAWDDNVPGVLRNAAVLVSPDGCVRRYDKVNLASFGPFEEGLYFASGGVPAPMTVNGISIGPVICYDLFFPELAKHYALQGAQAIICLSASPITSREYFEKIVPARAIENTAYCLYINQVGTQLNQVYFGGAEAAGPMGDRLAKAKYFEEDVCMVDILPERVRAARASRPTLRDTLSCPFRPHVGSAANASSILRHL